MHDSQSFKHVRDSLVSVFGVDRVHFTTRRENATFPCVVWGQIGEQVLPMISNEHMVISIDVTVDVQSRNPDEAREKSNEARRALELGRHAVRRTSFDVVEYDTATEDFVAPQLFVASSTYNVSE